MKSVQVFVALASFAAGLYLTTHYAVRRVEAESIKGTLCPGDYLVIRMADERETSPSTTDISRGDIGVFSRPPSMLVVKRVVGLPGDTIKSEGTHLIINGQSESGSGVCYGRFQRTAIQPRSIDLKGQVELSSSELFLAGDNRDFSIDSRDFGPISLQSFAGKVVFFVRPPWKPGCRCGGEVQEKTP